MKSKDIFALMMNPFTRIAGLQAFVLGLVFVMIMGVMGTYFNVAFDGILDMHPTPQMTFVHSFSLLGIDLFSLVFVMWVTASIISKSFRFIDILGTMTLAKAPFLILAMTGYFTKSIDIKDILRNPHLNSPVITLIVIGILSIPILIWTVTLMYNALKISCDVKGSKLSIAFIVAILLSEIVSKILLLILL